MRVSPPICPPITRWTGSGVRSVTDITQGAKSSRASEDFQPILRVRRRTATWMGKREVYSLSGCLTPFSAAPTLCQTDAGVAELADAQDSGSCGVHSSCGFKSLLRYQRTRGPWVSWAPSHLRQKFASAHRANSLAVRRTASHLDLMEFATSETANSQAVRRTAPHRVRPGLQVPPPVPRRSIGAFRPRVGGLLSFSGTSASYLRPSGRCAPPRGLGRRTAPGRSRIGSQPSFPAIGTPE